MTKANITVNGEDFWVRSDGQDAEDIKDVFQFYIDEAKKNLKRTKWEEIAKLVIMLAIRDGQNPHAWISQGNTSYASYNYKITINEKGDMEFMEVK